MEQLYCTDHENKATQLSCKPLQEMIAKIKSQRGKQITIRPRRWYKIISSEEYMRRQQEDSQSFI